MIDKLIELLKSSRVLDVLYDTDEEWQYAADYLIANGVTVGDANNATTTWISVEDRLPEREGKYLTYTTRGTIEISSFYPFYLNDKPQVDYWITHWMPLPEAPKGDNE